MTRREEDREDLMAEATALVERVELAVSGRAEHVVVGWRGDGAASFFFGQDEVYHFNARGELRRAYRDGTLYKASAGRLVAMTRERTEREVQLISRSLDAKETAEFVARARGAMESLAGMCQAGTAKVVARVPLETDGLGRIIAQVPVLKNLAIASGPGIT